MGNNSTKASNKAGAKNIRGGRKHDEKKTEQNVSGDGKDLLKNPFNNKLS